MTFAKEPMPAQANDHPINPWFKKLGCVIPLIVGLAFAIFIGKGFIVAARLSKLPTYFKNGIDFPLDDLPPSASDVHFRYSGGGEPWGTAYEFQCTEKDFRQWASKARVNNPKLTGIRTESPYVLPVVLSDGTMTSITAREVLISDWRHLDQSHSFAYDLDRNRAITWSMSR